MAAVLYTIFHVKSNKPHWPEDEKLEESPTHEIRAYLLLECGFFFGWILVSVFFTLYAYIFKIKSISKSDIVMESDDNVWNDKDTDDFLRYLKFEYFMVSYVLIKGLMEIWLGFIPRDDIAIFGTNDFYPVSVIFIILICNSVLSLTNVTMMLRNVDDHIDIEEAANTDLYSRTKTNKAWYIFKAIAWLGMFIAICCIYFLND